MLRNYLTISLCTLRRDRTTSLVSVLGLAVGLAAGLLIFLLVSYMFSFDRYHPHRLPGVIRAGHVHGGGQTREIGIGKVLGAGVPRLLWLFGREFGKLIGLGFLPAAVLGGLLMNGWLQGYAYRITLGWWVFALGLVAVVTLLTVAREFLRAALQNPVRSLRTE
jgi:hypothetical protein